MVYAEFLSAISQFQHNFVEGDENMMALVNLHQRIKSRRHMKYASRRHNCLQDAAI